MIPPAYLEALASAMGVPVARFGVPGTSVCAGEDRRGERLVSHYRVGEHSVVWSDPEVVDSVAVVDGLDHPLDFDEFRRRASALGGERLGRGHEYLLPADWVAPADPPAITRLDGAAGETRVLVELLLGECSPDDREEADFEIEALDPFLCGWMEDDRLLALAGARRWPPRPGHHDLGVITSPRARRRGCGAAVVAAVSALALAEGGQPLYRHDDDNVGSGRLCRSVGYERVVSLEAFRWPS